MCGIVGCIGRDDIKEILLTGLEKLEYRGYDSAGIALFDKEQTEVFKEKGRIATLRSSVAEDANGSIGIGHTRWATHGVPNQVNAHPHQSSSNRFTLVHNGVIENYEQLKREHIPHVSLQSDTDTEVIVQMIEVFRPKFSSTAETLREVLKLVKGSYAIALIDKEDENTFYVAKNKSPLLVGVGEDFNVVASDAMATLQLTDQYVEIMDKEIVIVKKDAFEIQDLNGKTITRDGYTAEIDASDIEKGTYPHFMLKEIDEQPFVIRNIIQKYQDEQGTLHVNNDILKAMKQSDRIYIVACGTSYHAGLIGKEYLEKISNIPVEVHIASEFVYNTPLLSKKPFFVYISQSGETADSRAVLVKTNQMGHPSLTITNAPGSTLSREANYTLLLHAGPEIAVASTKAYTAQIAVLLLLSVALAEEEGIELPFNPLQELAVVANALEVLCNQKDKIEHVAKDFLSTTRNAFFIGRGMDYFVCLEAALKLKEISYIQAEGFAGGELKHGTIALIEEGTPVIALATQEHVNLNIRGNVKEVVARGANPCILSLDGLQEENDTFVLPHVHELLTAFVTVVPLQLLSYYAALHRGCDVDKPRNLAKSVTVE